MLGEFALIVSNQRLKAVDLIYREDQPILVMGKDDDRLRLDQYRLRVEDIMMAACDQADTEWFERVSSEKLSEMVVNHEAPIYAVRAGKRSTRAISFSHIQAR